MAYVPANPDQKLAVQIPTNIVPAPTPLDLSPPTGEATPQTHTSAALTG